MTVATLIKKLETMPQDAVVIHYNYNEEIKDWQEIKSAYHMTEIIRPLHNLKGNFVIVDDEEVDEVYEGWYEEEDEQSSSRRQGI